MTIPTITILGAGSTVFARQLITDILQIEGLDEGCFALVDIDASRLELARQITERLITHSGKRWIVRASTERLDLLAGTDFIINTIVGKTINSPLLTHKMVHGHIW